MTITTAQLKTMRTEILSYVADGFPTGTDGRCLYPLAFKILLVNYVNSTLTDKQPLSKDEIDFRRKLLNTALVTFKGRAVQPTWNVVVKLWRDQHAKGILDVSNAYSVSALLAKVPKKPELSPSELLAKRLAELKSEVEAVTEEHRAALELAAKLENKRESLKAAMVSVMEDYVATI